MKSNSLDEEVSSPGKYRVEVIVCTFNGEKYIAEQLCSILSQSCKPDLISIYDDASMDGTIGVVRQTIERDLSHIETRIVRNEKNLGYVGNFSKGIKAAKGDILFLCDQDDRWHSDKIQIALELLNEAAVDMVFSDGRLIDADGKVVRGKSVLMHYGLSRADISSFSAQAVARLARRNYINGAAMAIRRESAMAALPVPAGLPHDYWLAIWCALHGGIAASPRCLYDYRQHFNNVIGVGLGKWYYLWYEIMQSPSVPRLQEHARYLELVPRVGEKKNAAVFVEKLRWLDACVAQRGRMSRLWAILISSASGQYRRFGGGYSWVRDVLAVIAVTK